MSNIKPVYLFALVAVLLLVAFIKINNPHRKYSTKDYWQGATIETAREVPEEALKFGNENGPVIAWAAIGSSNTKVLGVLVERGADINEREVIFSGTPLTIAAANGQYPHMLRELVRLGADVHVRVQGDATALMLAVAYNENMDILQELIDLGVPLDAKNTAGETAYEYAVRIGNQQAVSLLKGRGHNK